MDRAPATDPHRHVSACSSWSVLAVLVVGAGRLSRGGS